MISGEMTGSNMSGDLFFLSISQSHCAPLVSEGSQSLESAVGYIMPPTGEKR